MDDASNARTDAPAACVLVVEDDAMLRRVVVRTLQGWGYHIREAGDGGSAVDAALSDEEPLNVILLDIMLPVLNGVEVARQVLGRKPEMPIVACSAALNTEVERDLREAGVRHFLPKPFSADSLRESIRRAIGA